MPTSKVYNKNKLDNDLNNFFRLKKLKAHFKDSINRDIDDQNRLFKANKQDLTPDKKHHTSGHLLKLQIKISNVLKLSDLKNHIQTSIRVKEEIQKVSKREDIIINNVDKRGALVNVDRKDYIKEAESQLNDKDNYHMLPQDLTLGNNKLVNQAIDCFFFKMITDKVADGLKMSVPRTLRFYITPKIHKSGNQGCLAIRSFHCHTVIISKYIDNHLQSIVK